MILPVFFIFPFVRLAKYRFKPMPYFSRMMPERFTYVTIAKRCLCMQLIADKFQIIIDFHRISGSR